MLQIFMLLLLYFSNLIHGFQSFKKLHLPASSGSEAYAFDPSNGGPYTGLTDGRIVKYQSPEVGFVDFATTTPNRSKGLCDGTDGTDTWTSVICGKPLGLEFNQKTGQLYVVDAYQGLMVVGKYGGLATQLIGGLHLNFADAIDIDQNTGIIYITDVGTIINKDTNMTDLLLKAHDRHGRLLRYDPTTRRYSVVLTGLAMPFGLAVSKDGSFVLVGEYLLCNITRYWVRGHKANTSETFVYLPGNPDNIKRTTSGDFWVAVNIQKLHPELTAFSLGQRISAEGQILETVNFYREYNATYVTEVQEHFGHLYVASLFIHFVGVYSEMRC